MLEMDSLAHMYTEFVELANQYEDMRLQMRNMQEAVRSLAEEEQRLKLDVHGMEDMMKKVRQSEQGLPLRNVLLHVLDKLRFHRQDVRSFVEANWQTAQAQEPSGRLAGYWGNLDARDEEFLWSNCTAKDRSHFRGRLDEHKIKLAAQTATDLVMADTTQPSHVEHGAGPSQLHGSDL
ncbi:hypothetical protein R1sor_027161 [Riccia sorocarpa]|uniref:Uncharacterized protein n=1 Tax=Riccia sorocarpa TaxID=122646 RepID=A0ABD3GE52_9MARC